MGLFKRESVVAVVKKNELHPKVGRSVDFLLNRRGTRAEYSMLGGPFGTLVGNSLVPYPSPAFAIGTVLGAYTGYQIGSGGVRKQTQKIGRLAFQSQVDAAGKVRFDPEKHVGFVTRKGDLVILNKTKFQAALQRAQRSFWKGVIPARYRF